MAGGCAASARVTATTPGRGQMNALTRGEESAFVSTPNGKDRNNVLVKSLERSRTFICEKAQTRARSEKPEELVQSLVKEVRSGSVRTGPSSVASKLGLDEAMVQELSEESDLRVMEQKIRDAFTTYSPLAVESVPKVFMERAEREAFELRKEAEELRSNLAAEYNSRIELENEHQLLMDGKRALEEEARSADLKRQLEIQSAVAAEKERSMELRLQMAELQRQLVETEKRAAEQAANLFAQQSANLQAGLNAGTMTGLNGHGGSNDITESCRTELLKVAAQPAGGDGCFANWYANVTDERFELIADGKRSIAQKANLLAILSRQDVRSPMFFQDNSLRDHFQAALAEDRHDLYLQRRKLVLERTLLFVYSQAANALSNDLPTSVSDVAAAVATALDEAEVAALEWLARAVVQAAQMKNVARKRAAEALVVAASVAEASQLNVSDRVRKLLSSLDVELCSSSIEAKEAFDAIRPHAEEDVRSFFIRVNRSGTLAGRSVPDQWDRALSRLREAQHPVVAEMDRIVIEMKDDKTQAFERIQEFARRAGSDNKMYCDKFAMVFLQFAGPKANQTVEEWLTRAPLLIEGLTEDQRSERARTVYISRGIAPPRPQPRKSTGTVPGAGLGGAGGEVPPTTLATTAEMPMPRSACCNAAGVVSLLARVSGDESWKTEKGLDSFKAQPHCRICVELMGLRMKTEAERGSFIQGAVGPHSIWRCVSVSNGQLAGKLCLKFPEKASMIAEELPQYHKPIFAETSMSDDTRKAFMEKHLGA